MKVCYNYRVFPPFKKRLSWLGWSSYRKLVSASKSRQTAAISYPYEKTQDPVFFARKLMRSWPPCALEVDENGYAETGTKLRRALDPSTSECAVGALISPVLSVTSWLTQFRRSNAKNTLHYRSPARLGPSPKACCCACDHARQNLKASHEHAGRTKGSPTHLSLNFTLSSLGIQSTVFVIF